MIFLLIITHSNLFYTQQTQQWTFDLPCDSLMMTVLQDMPDLVKFATELWRSGVHACPLVILKLQKPSFSAWFCFCLGWCVLFPLNKPSFRDDWFFFVFSRCLKQIQVCEFCSKFGWFQFWRIGRSTKERSSIQHFKKDIFPKNLWHLQQ